MDTESKTVCGNIEHEILQVESFEDIIDVENEMGFGEGEDWGDPEEIGYAKLAILKQAQHISSCWNDGFLQHERTRSCIPYGRPTVTTPLASSCDDEQSNNNKDVDVESFDRDYNHQGHLIRDDGGQRKSMAAIPLAPPYEDGEHTNNDEDVSVVPINHLRHRLIQAPKDGTSMAMISPAFSSNGLQSKGNEDVNLVSFDHHGHRVVQAPEDYGQKRPVKGIPLASSSDCGVYQLKSTVPGDVAVGSSEHGQLQENGSYDQNAAISGIMLRYEHKDLLPCDLEGSASHKIKPLKKSSLKSQGKETFILEPTASHDESVEDLCTEDDGSCYSSRIKGDVVKKGILKLQGKDGHLMEMIEQAYSEDNGLDSLPGTNFSSHSPKDRIKRDGVRVGTQNEKWDACKEGITRQKKVNEARSSSVNRVRFSLDHGMGEHHTQTKAADSMVGEKGRVQKEVRWKFGGANQNESLDYNIRKGFPRTLITMPKRSESVIIRESLQDPSFDLKRLIDMREDKKRIRLANERIERLEDGLVKQHEIVASMRISLASESSTRDFGKVRMLLDSLEKNIRKLKISKTRHCAESHQLKSRARQIEKLKARVNLLDADKEMLKKKLKLAVESSKSKEKELETLTTEREKVLQRRGRELEKCLQDQQNKSLSKSKAKAHEVSSRRERALAQTVKEEQHNSVEDWKIKLMTSESKERESAVSTKEREKALERRVKALEKSLDDDLVTTLHATESPSPHEREHAAPVMNDRERVLEGGMKEPGECAEDWPPNQHVVERSKLTGSALDLATEREKALEQRVSELQSSLVENSKRMEKEYEALMAEREIALRTRVRELEVSLSKEKEYEALITERANAVQRRVMQLEMSLRDHREAQLGTEISEREKALERKASELEKSLDHWEATAAVQSREREEALERRVKELEKSIDDWEARSVVESSEREKYVQQSRVEELESSLQDWENKLVLQSSKAEEQEQKLLTAEKELQRRVVEVGKSLLKSSKSEQKECDPMPTEREKALEERVKELQISLQEWEHQIAVERSEKKILEQELETYLKDRDAEHASVSSESKEKVYQSFVTEGQKALQRHEDEILITEREKALDGRVRELEKSLEVLETKLDRSKSKESEYEALSMDREKALEGRVRELEKFLEDWGAKVKKIESDFTIEEEALGEKATVCKMDWKTKSQRWASKLKDRESELSRLKSLEESLVECSVSCIKSLESLKSQAVAHMRQLVVDEDVVRRFEECDATREVKISSSYGEDMAAVEIIQTIQTGIQHVQNMLYETSSRIHGKQDLCEESRALEEKVSQTLGLMATLKQEMKSKEDQIKAENEKYALSVAEKTKQVEALESQLIEKEQDMESFVQELKDEVSLLNKELEREHRERSRLLNDLYSQGDMQPVMKAALKEQGKVTLLKNKVEEMRNALFLKDKRIMSLEEEMKDKAALLVRERQEWNMAIKEVKQKAARTILRFAYGKENGLLEHLRERRKAQRALEEEGLRAHKTGDDDDHNEEAETERPCLTTSRSLQTDGRTHRSLELKSPRQSTHSVEPIDRESEAIGRRKEVKVIPRAYRIEGTDFYTNENSEASEVKRDSKREILKLLQRKRCVEEKQRC